MTGFFALLRRQAAESRWFLGLSALILFGFGWLFVYVTAGIETRIAEMGGGRRFNADTPSIEIQLRFWQLPPILLPVIVWAIARGSGAVAAEIERGTLDLTLSRPVPRRSYLLAQVTIGVLGLLALGLAMILGNMVGMQYNTLNRPPGVLALSRPGLNLAALGLAVFGVALWLSSLDVVRWRPNLIASSLAFVEFIAPLIGGLESLEDYRETLESLSIFTAYDPLTAATGPTADFAFNVGLLAAIGAVGIILAFVTFQVRDLPANS